MKYCYELYENKGRGNIFLGYKTINASSSEEARQILDEKINDESIMICQVFINQD